MTRVRVNVTYHAGVGYVSVANHKVTRSLAALSLEGRSHRPPEASG